MPSGAPKLIINGASSCLCCAGEYYTPRSITYINDKDALYFCFKKIITDPKISKTRIMDKIYRDIEALNLENTNIKQHFYPLNIHSHKWWSRTHYYIYYYKEVYTILHSLCYIDECFVSSP